MKVTMKTIITAVISLFASGIGISQCPGLQANHFTQDETCFGSGDGSLFWNPSGSTGPFNFYIHEDGSNNLIYQGTNNSHFGMFAGSYYLVIEDLGNVCSDTSYFVITSPVPLQTLEILQNASCSQCNGSITVTTSGGTAPYSYNWFANGNLIGSGPTIPNLCPDTYTVEVVDVNGCSEIVDYTIISTGGLTGSTTITDNTLGNCDGSINSSIGGGTAPYTYNWTGPNTFTSTQQNISSICAGIYNLEITDANGCIYTTADTLTNSNVVSTYNQFDAWCNGQPGGAIDVFPSGGSGNYNLEVTDLSYGVLFSSTSMTVNNLFSGSYYYIVTDLVTMNADTVSFFINEPPPIILFDNISHDACGQCAGFITVNATGGTAPYTYGWSNGATTPTINGLCAGTYIVDVIDVNGCIATNSYTVNATNPGISITGNITPATCGLCDGQVDATISGAGPFTYQWDDANSQTTEDAVGLCQGYYTLTVTDNNGCILDSIFTVGELNNIFITTNTSNSSCTSCVGTADILVNGGTAPYTYDLQTQNNSTGNFMGLCAGTQTILVTDANGCTGFDQVYIENDTLSIPSLIITATNETGVGTNDGTANLYFDTIAHPNVIVSWSPANSNQLDLYNLGQGWQTVTLTDTVSGDCAYTSVYVGNDQTYIYISGTIFTDADGDCIYDAGEVTVANQTIIVTDGTNSYTAITNNMGYYSAIVPSGNNYTVTTTLTGVQSTVCNNGVSVNVGSVNVSGINIGLTVPPIENLCVWNYNFGFVPGFSCMNPISVYNNGNVVSSGTVSFIVPPMTTFDYSLPTPDNIVGDTLFWNISNLAPNSSMTINLALLCDVSTPLGAYVETCTHVELLGGGQNTTPSCQDYCYWNMVTGSFDPNDKTATPIGEGIEGNIAVDEDEFFYTIRFQNTGTGPAVNIYITDTLQAMLDRSSLEMVSASHPYEIEYYANDVIRWRFNNINLPDSGANEMASHGYVTFKIKTQNTPALGETVENTANIYFDFNEPVITNTTLNTYADMAASISKLDGKSMKLFPNPANDEINILSMIEGIKTVEIYSISGTLVLKKTFTNQLSKIDVSDFANGMYIVKSYDSLNSEHATFVKE